MTQLNVKSNYTYHLTSSAEVIWTLLVVSSHLQPHVFHKEDYLIL